MKIKTKIIDNKPSWSRPEIFDIQHSFVSTLECSGGSGDSGRCVPGTSAGSVCVDGSNPTGDCVSTGMGFII